jgi:hypothetical protein
LHISAHAKQFTEQLLCHDEISASAALARMKLEKGGS